MKYDESELKEVLIRQSTNFLLDYEIVENEVIINTLILMGFVSHSWINNVEITINPKEKEINFYLLFKWYILPFVNKKRVEEKLVNLVRSGLKNYKVQINFITKELSND